MWNSIVSDTKSFSMALLLLSDISLFLESVGRVATLCRSEFLLRLVERQQYRYILENLEHAGASLGCAVSKPISVHSNT